MSFSNDTMPKIKLIGDKVKKKVIKLSFLSLVICTLLHAEDTKTILDEIMVTANKVEENIKDVSQNITVLDEEILKEKNINTITKIIDEIPNMNSSSISGMGTFANFRGINTSIFNAFSSPVVVYVDGVPTTSRYTYQASMANAKSVEVLRGPQGTIYGKDSIGSVINIITRDSSDEVNGEIGAEYGTNKFMKTTFNLNAPIIENKLYAGINGEFQKDDGNLTNIYNGISDDKAAKSESKNVNLYLKYLVSDNLSLKLTGSKSTSKDYGSDSATYTSSLNSLSQSSYNDTQTSDYDMPTSEKKGVDSLSLSLNYDFDKFNFDWVSTYKKVDFDGDYDVDYTSGNSLDGATQYNNFETKSYSNEFRLSNNNDSLKWIAGLYLDDEDYNESTGYDNYSFYGKYDASGNLGSNTKSLFGQVMLPLNDRIDLTLGGRYQRIKKDANIDVTVENSPTFNYSFNTDKTWNSFLPKIALSYEIDDMTNTYISISKGYMPGGFNTFPSSTNIDNNSYDEQTSINYELGYKGIVGDFIFNTSIFYMDIKDLQLHRVVGTGARQQWITDNAHSAHSYGLEIEGRYFINDSLDVSGNIGLIKAKYDKYDAGNTSFDGHDIENTPSHTANVTLTYHGDSGFYALGSIYNRGNISFYDTASQKFFKDKSATTANVKIGKKFSAWEVYSYVNNITDKHYVTNYFSKGSLSSVAYNEGRFIGIGAKYKF